MAYISIFAVAAVAGIASAVWLPGARPNEYEYGQKVEMKVNKLWSAKTQLTYNYYTLPFCQPGTIVDEISNENFGQILVGDRIQNSAYVLELGKDTSCNVLCPKKYSQDEIDVFKERIDNEYTVNWILDGLQAAVKITEDGEDHYERGFPLGLKNPQTQQYYIINHITFNVHVHQEDGQAQADLRSPASAAGKKFRIVGFEVDPNTYLHRKKEESKGWTAGNLATCLRDGTVSPQQLLPGSEILYTYDVVWHQSETPWAQRWDMYLRVGQDDDIHWFSIVNSLMIVLFLTGMIAMILMRNLYRDIAKYNEETSDEAAEETGWKLVHGDVFRPPAGFFGPMFLSVFVGNGIQLGAMAFLLLIFAVMGFLSPANQGSFLTGFIVLYVFSGLAAGIVSARLYKMFRGKAWKRNTSLTAFAFPGAIFSISLFLNFFFMYKRSSLAVPIKSILGIFLLWAGVCVPLVFLGSYLGFKREEIRHPVRVNNIPRQIPPQPWYLHPVPSVLVGGILPFGAVFIELFFIMSSIWLAQVYYVFGFLFLVLLILVVTCAEISIVMCYFQLCSEDYNWWWRSFLTSGSSAVYLFAYSIVYFVTKLEIKDPIPSMVYFGYMAMASWGFFLFTGAIGFVACLTFVNRIYAAIKVD